MNKNVELVFITTCTDLNNVFKLLNSIRISNNKVNLLIVIVVQNGLSIDIMQYCTLYTDIVIIREKKTISLSLARNIALNYISAHEIKYKYVMFPDDDSVYDELFFEKWEYSGQGNRLINVKCSDSNDYFNYLMLPNMTQLTTSQYKMSSSVNMIIDQETVEATGLFDERLGVGALYGAGEDNDFFIRASKVSPFLICTTIYNMHPSPEHKYDLMNLSQIIKRFNNYGRGVVFMLCKNELKMEALFICFRALGGALLNFLRFRFKLAVAYLCSFVSRVVLFLRLIWSHEYYRNNCYI